MDSELTLHDYVTILRRRWWVVTSVFIVVLVASLVWSALQTPLYRSTTRVLINQASAAEIFDSQSTQNTSFADRVAANEVALIESQLVRDVAQASLGYEATINASVQTRADVISISAVDPDPAIAQQIAQTFADTYLDVRREQYVAERVDVSEQLLTQIADIDEQIEEASGADASRLQRLRDNLATELEQLRISADLSPRASRVIDQANLPANAFSPQVARNLALGGVLGLLLGVGAALLMESLDRSVRSREVIESLTPGVPSLAVVPVMRSNTDLVTLASPDGAQAEIFSTLRAALEFASVDDSIRILQVTSAGASAGKTTIAANLGVSMAQAGQTVAVIDGDLRRPRIHEIFGLDQVPGLTSAILGRETLNSAARELRLDNGRLRVYPSGPVPPGPAELLGSRRAREVFAALKRNFDVLIIDSPPVLPVADALVISRLADATLLVANARRTRRDDLARSFEALQHAGANVIGTVLNAATGDSLAGYGYGYGYGQESDGGMRGFFRRRNPGFAPRRAGTETLERDELPKFEAARVGRRPSPLASSGSKQPRSKKSADTAAASSDVTEYAVSTVSGGSSDPTEPSPATSPSDWGDDVTVS